NSVRVRLTLWNACLMALVLAGSGIALCYQVQADLMRSVDRDLAQDADRVAMGWAHRQEERDHPPPRGDGPHHFGPPGRPAPPPTVAERHRDLLRPRVLTLKGGAVGQGWWAQDRPWDWKTLALSAAGDRCYSTVKVEGEPLRVFSRPVVINGRIENVVQ